MDFVAIDFETANASRDSACALGAVVVRNNQIVARKYNLLNPRVPFDQYCTHIHGITQKVAERQPCFEDIYPALFDLLNGQVVVAHNASFDIAVLQASCRSRGLQVPRITPFCSVEMARKAWPHLVHHRLNALCEEFQIPLRHHNAVEDSTACARLVLLCAQQLGADDFPTLERLLEEKAATAQ